MSNLPDGIVVLGWVWMMIYMVMLLRWLFGWWNYTGSKEKFTPIKSMKKAAVIIAVRNEENTIGNLIDSLSNQNYGNYEVIIVDDFSNDNTESVARELIQANDKLSTNFKFIKANVTDQTGKKAAILRGIKQTNADVIITTDADCSMGKYWIHSIMHHFQNDKIYMVTGFVKISPYNTIFDKMQALEFLSLSATGASSVIVNKPLMCNGANLAFLRKMFLEVDGYSYGGTDPSGDDTYLMLTMRKINKTGIVFNYFNEGVVSTEPVSRFKDLLYQRIRWASKVKNYKENYIKNTGLFLFALNLFQLAFLIMCVFGYISVWVTGGFWIFKAVIDLIFLLPFLKYSHQQNLLFLFLPMQLIYPVYSLVGGIMVFANKRYIWKGREF